MRRVTLSRTSSDPTVQDAKMLGALVRAARCRSGMTLADAALSLGIAKQTLANLETAKSSVGLDTALRAAHQFGVAVFAVPASQREPVRHAIEAVQAMDAKQAPEAVPGNSPAPRRSK